ncbi:MAG: phosphomethylpyrimidine synthase ThiC, partial [Promethearchaeia archaeon]
LTAEMRYILKIEPISRELLINGIADGTIVIIKHKKINPVAMGNGVRSKILCNIGTSSINPDYNKVLAMAKLAERYGASVICDLSTGPHFYKFREYLLNQIKIPIASIPIYQNAEQSLRLDGNIYSFTADDIIKIFREQVKIGIASPGIHTISKKLLNKIKSSDRIIPITSRGAGILSKWMKINNEENPYIKYFDDILDICALYDVPITLVSGTRSGCLADGFDEIQVEEWNLMGNLIKRAHKRDVSVIVNGIGHLRMDLIPKAVKTFKKIVNHVPLGVMGPAITDRALGSEHIAHAIGAAIAISNGANYCQNCCRTEHLGLPEPEDIIESLITYRIAVYGADLVKIPELQKNDDEISKFRYKNIWGKQLALAINQEIALETFKRVGPKESEKKGCTICGDMCPFMNIMEGGDINDKGK